MNRKSFPLTGGVCGICGMPIKGLAAHWWGGKRVHARCGEDAWFKEWCLDEQED